MEGQAKKTENGWVRRVQGIGRAASALLVMLWSVTVAAEAVVYLADESQLDSSSAAPQHALPVLFVHGHKPSLSSDPDPNYQINWQKPFGSLPSFKQALDLSQNASLDIEPYYIHFEDQGRSMVEDAADIADAVERILARHDPSHIPGTQNPTTAVKVAIIAYSKGTISSRLYLKSLQVQQAGLPAPRVSFNPISELVAISPPNHGLALADLYTATTTSLRQLNNGYKQNCDSFSSFPFDLTEQEDFIEELNGHSIEDSQTAPLGSYSSEAPGSRSNGTHPSQGTLYLTLVADGGRDFVGGSQPSADCQGRVLAMNLAPDAEHREFSSIAPGETDTGLTDSDVHQETVHTPDVMCMALYTVVHHRAPEDEDGDFVSENFQCAMPTGVPVVPPRAALVQVLDLSGSMLTLACAGCDPKLQVLQEAVQIFVDLWSLAAGPADQVGVQLFGSQVRPLDPNAPPLLPVTSANAEAINTRVAGLTTVPAELTAMGGGLQQAIGILQQPQNAAIPQRHVLLFSDGMQNVNPMVEWVDGSLKIIEVPGRPASNVTAQDLVLDPGSLGGIRVHTIGVGATEPYMTRLVEIATATEGTPYSTLAPDEMLRQHFIETLIEVLRGNSPQLVDYRRATLTGDSATESFVIGRGGRRVILKLSWRPGNSLAFRVKKGGADLTSLGRMVKRDFYQLFVLELPVRAQGQAIDSEGAWELQISGRKGVGYEVAAIVDEPTLDYRLSLARPLVAAGEPLEIRLRLSSEGRPLTAADTVQAVVQRPGNSLANLLAEPPIAGEPREPQVEGAGAAATRLQRLLEQKTTQARLAPAAHSLTLSHVGDGEYLGTFTATEIPGPYAITVHMAGEDPVLGAYRRRATLSGLVRAGAAVASHSELSLKPLAVAGGLRRLELMIIPRDRFGNHIGPDYGGQLQLTVDGKPRHSVVTDGLDGSYLTEFAIEEGTEPALRLSVLGATLFEGPVSEITTRKPASRLGLWLAVVLVLILLAVVVLRIRSALR
jgi:hypothetical protein